mmetsp:Transcript_33575/g.73272  ORF Transcript_33575/g.73272 Transcript_33575/m.73272 type:complete len:140 (+) Transcript_33575:1064-1483(+)
MCEPSSATLPSRMTMMRSQSLTVERRCATVMHVRPLDRPCSDAWMPCSVLESRAEVASSHTTRRGLRTKARAMATRCFSPPLSFSPRSPTTVAYFSGNFVHTVSWSCAASAASMISSLVTPGRPKAMLLRSVSLKSAVS